MAPMTDRTPYRERPLRERLSERRCMQTIFEQAPQVDHIFEAFGGTGDTAEVMRATFPQAQIHSFDLDADCCAVYDARQIPRATITQGDAVAGARVLGHHLDGELWGASLDYNRFTILDLHSRRTWRSELLWEVMGRRPLWVQLTDSARPYLHLNWHRYPGVQAKSNADYAWVFSKRVEELWGYRLLSMSFHSRATYFLFVAP